MNTKKETSITIKIRGANKVFNKVVTESELRKAFGKARTEYGF